MTDKLAEMIAIAVPDRLSGSCSPSFPPSELMTQDRHALHRDYFAVV